MFQISSLSKSFSGQRLFHGLNLEFYAGETTALIGPSGCGKSTILKLLLGLEFCDEGTIAFQSRPLGELDIDAYRRKIGYMIQSGGLFPHLSNFDNVVLVARFLRWSPESIGERIRKLLDLTGLEASTLDRRPGEISGGQRQRVAFMRALMLDPEVLMLDEPMGALDPIVRADMQKDLKAMITALGKTVIIVTHDMREALRIADRIVLLNDGSVAQDGGRGDFIDHPKSEFVRHFVTSQLEGL